MSETEFNSEEMTEEQDTEVTATAIAKKPIRELTAAEKRKRALLAKTRLKTYDFMTIPKGASWEIETSFDRVELKQVKKYKSEDLEWKLVVKCIIPHIDPNAESELRFTPKQGDKLQTVLALGYTRIRITRNEEDANKTDYKFEGLE